MIRGRASAVSEGRELGMILKLALGKHIMYNRFPIQFRFDGKQYRGEVKPLAAGVQNRMPVSFQVFLNNVYYGDIRRKGDNWETDSPKCAIMVETLGNHIYDWYL